MKKLITITVIFSLLALSCGSKNSDPPVDKEKMLENHKGLAVASLRRGNFQQALKEVGEAESINNKDPEVYEIKGLIYFGLKDYPTAEQFYKKSLSIKPDSKVSFNLCALYLRQEKYNQVITECAKSAADTIYDARENAYTTIGLAYFKLGDMPRALENYEKALEINPSYVYTHNELGKLFMSIGRDGEAIEQFNLAVEGYPGYDEAYFNLGIAYLKLNDKTEACTAFTRVVELSPNTKYGMNSRRYLSGVCKQ